MELNLKEAQNKVSTLFFFYANLLYNDVRKKNIVHVATYVSSQQVKIN